MTEVNKLKARVERLEAWVEGDCRCPCCEELRECAPDCTFAEDAPEDSEAMAEAREVMYG